MISLLEVLALWGNNNWPPSMKVQQIENCQNKMGVKGCKWSSLNATGTQTSLSHSVLEFENLPFLINSPLHTVFAQYRPKGQNSQKNFF